MSTRQPPGYRRVARRASLDQLFNAAATPFNGTLICSAVEMALFGTNWHGLGGALSQKANSRNKLRQIEKWAGTLTPVAGKKGSRRLAFWGPKRGWWNSTCKSNRVSHLVSLVSNVSIVSTTGGVATVQTKRTRDGSGKFHHFRLHDFKMLLDFARLQRGVEAVGIGGVVSDRPGRL